MRRLCYCDPTSGSVVRFELFADDAQVVTNLGTKRADALVACTKAALTIAGQANNSGNVTYTANHGGTVGNRIFVEHEIGPSGADHLSRPLAVNLDAVDEDGIRIVVTFGTTSAGAPMRPTAQQVANLINASPAADYVTATPGGTGNAGADGPTYLSGGLDNGDWRKFNVKRGECLRINSVEVL